MMPDQDDRLAGYGFDAVPLRDDNPSRVDLLGFDDIVAAVKSTITRPALNPITVGINAPWGGGKTTVLRLLQKQLVKCPNVLVVYVSPWEYDRKTDTKATLIGAVLEILGSKLREKESKAEAAIRRLKKLRKRINFAKGVTLAATSALTMSLPSIDALTSLFDKEGEANDPSLLGFREEFQELLSSDELQHISQVVVLVDDLDRSLPDTVVDTLEAIKLFLSVEKMAFVIAADEDNIARAISQKLESTGQPTTARQYLEKIVHIPFRIPALSRERTEEYLALLMMADSDNIGDLITQIAESRGHESSLAARLGKVVKDDQSSSIELAERLSPILHRHLAGNPRRLKRFLNAFWLRTAFARSRGLDLQPDACAKLMVAELIHTNLFAQMLGWLTSGTLSECIANIEQGKGDYSEQAFEWGRLQPPLADKDLSGYLLLAASLRGQTVEEAALPAALRQLATKLTGESIALREEALKDALRLETSQRSLLARHVAVQLRLEREPDRQKALSESLSGLANEPAIAMAVAEELLLIDPASVLPPVPLSLLSKNQPTELVQVVERWSKDSDVPERTRRAAIESLKGIR